MVVTNIKREVFDLIDYAPHPGQREFHDCRARFKVLIAGARYGKSLCATVDALYDVLRPGSRGWIVAPSYRLGAIEFRYLVTALEDLGVKFKHKRMGSESRGGSLETDMGSTVKVLSSRVPHNLLGEELDWVLLSEASQLKGVVWTKYLRPRLATRQGRMLLPTTPNGFNWVHDIYLRGLDPDFPEWKSFHYKTIDNPLIPEAEIEEARRTMPPAQFEEQFEGGFVNETGRVYPEFSADLHVVDDDELPDMRDWEHYGGLDFGWNNPFAMLFAAVGPGGRICVYDEYYHSQRTINVHANEVIARGGHNLLKIYADPSEASYINELRDKGLPIVKANNAVLHGIDQVRRRLMPGDDGGRGLVVSSRCRELIREFSKYRWGDGADSNGERRPLKQFDHALDALRYLCMSISERVQWSGVR